MRSPLSALVLTGVIFDFRDLLDSPSFLNLAPAHVTHARRFRHDLGHSSAAVSAWQMNPLRSPPQPLPPPLPPSTGTCADIDTAPAAGRARRFASPRRRCRKNNPYYMEKKFGGLKFMPYICTPEIRKDTYNAQVVKLVDTLL